MFKPTASKTVLFVTILIAGLSPLLIVDNGLALAIPVLQIVWLPGVASAFGASIAVNGGVDAFKFVPPNALGMSLMVVGFAISVAVQYAVACLLVTGASKLRSK